MADLVTNGLTTPQGWDDGPRARRDGPKGLVPSTWLRREVRAEYTGPDGKERIASGCLLDWFPFGPCLNVEGARTLISWDRITILELVGD